MHKYAYICKDKYMKVLYPKLCNATALYMFDKTHVMTVATLITKQKRNP